MSSAASSASSSRASTQQGQEAPPQQIRIKVILCGDYGVGKSSLFRRFVYDTFTESADRASTLGFDHFQKTYNIQGRKISLQLWDTGGLERIASVTTSYYKHADAALLVFASDAYDSFNSLPHHLLEVLTSAESAKLFLCANKADKLGQGMGPNKADVDKFMAEYQINEQEHLFRAQYYTSCKTNKGVHEMFHDLAERMLNQIQPPIHPDFIRLPHRSTDSDASQPPARCCGGGEAGGSRSDSIDEQT